MSGPNKYGSNKVKVMMVMPVDIDGNPVPAGELPTGGATSENQTTEIAALGTINTSIGTTNTGLGAPADAAASTDTGTFSLIALFKRLLSQLTTALGALGTLTANAISVRSQAGYHGTSTVTRAANQTPYTANDVVGGALTIATIGPTSGDVLIMSLQMILNITAQPAAMTSFRLYLYNVTPPSAIADNSPFTFGSGDRASFLGYIDNIVPSLLGTGTASVQAQLDAIVKQLRMPAGTSLFGYLVTNGAFTPAANSETYALTLEGQQV